MDRHDQLRKTFSLSERHGFKKYYVKIILGLMDMALVNAYIHYKLVNPVDCKKKSARYNFMEALANDLIDTEWVNFANSEKGKSNDSMFDAILNQGRPLGGAHTSGNKHEGEGSQEDNDTSSFVCRPISVTAFIMDRNKKNGFVCQVCAFEKRGKRLLSVVICSNHCLRLCTRSHDRKKLFKPDGNEITDYSWLAPDDSMSCWEKAHRFYIPKGLFKASASKVQGPGQSNDKRMKFVNASVSSDIYRAKRIALGAAPIRRGGHTKRKTRKSKGTAGDLVIMNDDDSEELACERARAATLDYNSDSTTEEE